MNIRPQEDTRLKRTKGGTYWSRRKSMMYYKYINELASVLACDAQSMIDIGSSNAAYIERFDWVPVRYTLDIRRPYRSETVKGIQADFFSFKLPLKFDFAFCLQVLEHVPEAERFAQKLLETADRVLISVPYRWPEGSNPEHVHDPVDLDKVAAWFGRRPDHHVVVTEPLDKPSKASRLICYYQSPAGSFSRRDLRRMNEIGPRESDSPTL